MSISDLDYQWFQRINELGHIFSALNPIMRLFASYAEYVFYLGVVVYWFTRQSIKRQMVVESLLSASFALGVSGLIGHYFYRDRPFVTHSVLQLISHPANTSFPSDHAIGAFVIATSIWLFRRKEGTMWLLLAACIAFSRVWTGVHYPLDVLAGAGIGITAAAAVHQLFMRSTRALKCLEAIIHLYEATESKLWRRIA
ncbi:undecaprenyl-diphosphatase [Paenibacillus sp. LjRoot153]|uniref:undecaprenyl-diphosphatase n=1 Tax=Paenibacillus sp. LjRoot153 TaxID=3342270 RepID=UPI003ECD8EC7